MNTFACARQSSEIKRIQEMQRKMRRAGDRQVMTRDVDKKLDELRSMEALLPEVLTVIPRL